MFQISAFMNNLKEKDSRERAELKTLMTKASQILDELSRSDDQIAKQLESENITRTWRGFSSSFHKLLQESTCPIIVAGKTLMFYPFGTVSYKFHLVMINYSEYIVN